MPTTVSFLHSSQSDLVHMSVDSDSSNSFLSRFQSKASLGNSPWDPPQSGPCSALLFFWSHLLLPTAHSCWAHWPLRSSQVQEQAPGSKCFHYFCREHSSLDIKAFLSHLLQSPAPVSSSETSSASCFIREEPPALQAASFSSDFFVFLKRFLKFNSYPVHSQISLFKQFFYV